MLDGVRLEAAARQIVQRLVVDQEAVSVQLHSRAEYLQVLGPLNRPALLRMQWLRLPTGLGMMMLKAPSTQAPNCLAERQVLDLLYEPDLVTARLTPETHESGGAGENCEIWPTTVRVEWTTSHQRRSRTA